MSIRKRVKAERNPYKQIWKQFSTAIKRLVNWLLRSLLAKGRRAHFSRSGFVLPTTILLLLIVTLVITALIARTSSRINQVIWAQEGKEISNAASPAIDRAKAKLEYLFNGDTRIPNGVPGQGKLVELLGDNSRYLLNGETRLDINGDGNADNAWSFRADTDGDGQQDATIAYSIIGTIPANQNTLFDQSSSAVSSRANSLFVRNGPINSATQASTACQQNQQNNAQIEDGWFVKSDNTAVLRKNFQVNALVLSDKVISNSLNRTVATLELQQDRQLDRGNKWGAWFRNDIELTQPPIFNWNGAMHTEGSIFVGGNDNFTAYLLSAPSSCVFSRTASEITNAEITNNQNQIQYQGQVVSGAVANNSILNNTNRFHFLDSGYQPVTSASDTRTQITKSTDSVIDSSVPSNIALDPVAIFTSDDTKAIGVSTAAGWASLRDSTWLNRDLVTNKRIYNQREPKPYVDDIYRADNLYGPKPKYSRDDTLAIPIGQKVGDPINSLTTSNAQVLNSLVSNDPIGSNTENVGLDGYWERRARREGLRVIVGQRLELGNVLGQPSAAITHQARQRRALRDNIAAVQATAIYHRANSDAAGNIPNFPVACLATTAHPGTAATINNSTKFNNISINGTSRLNTDFLTGNGTNGWEFNPPAGVTTEDNFANAIATGQPLRRALTNLAYLAGDPFGAFPARQDTQDANNANDAVPSVGPVVHPHPTLTAWGNFSNLRRVINLLDSGIIYANLSIADQSTLHTAACTLGMLTYNLNTTEAAYTAIASDTGSTNMNALGVQLSQLMDGVVSNGNPEIGRPSNGTNLCTSTGVTNCPSATYTSSYYSQFTGDEWINALKNSPGLGANQNDLVQRARLLMNRQQILRDRTFGFKPSSSASLRGSGPGYNATTGKYTLQSLNAGQFSPGQIFDVGCDPNSFPATGNGQGLERARLGLTMAFCSRAELPKYPSLFYLFPVAEHDHNGVASATALATNSTATVNQPSNEYISNTYIFNTSVTDDVNNGFIYKVLQDTNNNGIENGAENGIGAIAIQPRSFADWQLPNIAVANITTRPNTITERITNAASDSFRRVPFLDKGMFNGREMMNVRVLDFDLDLLRSNTLAIDPANPDDNWLPQTGIVYAFREDAVREDGIARPAITTWGNCNTATQLTTSASCLMSASTSTPQDPPITTNNGITPKPVDFLPDPDRRPYGFRLENGADLTRTSLLLTDANNRRGLSFISDNPVYIQGDFNLHSTNGTTSNLLEEFTQALLSDYSNFYTRNTIETRFAQPGDDRWRPSEIIADAVTVISNNFCDGSIEDSFTTAGTGSSATVPLAQYGCGTGNEQTSYLNQNRPSTSVSNWRRENPSDSGSAIAIDASGSPLRISGAYSGSYYTFSNSKALTSPAQTRINSIIVSGLVPSRANQFNGGLHNFPRFLEDWNGTTRLYISGALIQLNFSTQATAPWDQDAWEPGDTPITSYVYPYYDPPLRLWGYDVALQMAPAGPVARRFVSANNTRSEFYRELPLDDPYIRRLRCAGAVGSTTRIDPTATTATCL